MKPNLTHPSFDNGGQQQSTPIVASDLKLKIEAVNRKLGSTLLKYPVSLLTILSSAEIGVVLLWACIPLLTEPIPDYQYLNYWFYLGYYSLIYMLCASHLCFAAMYIYTSGFCCDRWKDYFVCVSSFVVANFVLGGIPGIAYEVSKSLEEHERSSVLTWVIGLRTSKLFWPIIPVVASAMYVGWCIVQFRSVTKMMRLSSKPNDPEVYTDFRPTKVEYQYTEVFAISKNPNTKEVLSFKGFLSWIIAIALILSTYFQAQIFSYFYFETAPHTFLFDVIAISALNFWIVIVMKHVGTFVVQKYAKRSDLIHVVYTFTHITSNVFYRNYILAKSLTEISVVAVINISGLLSLLKVLIWCSKRYFFFVHPDLARNNSVNNLALIASNQVHSVSNYYEKAVAHYYQIHIRSIALEYGETVRTQLITMLSFVCWTFMIRSGPNSKFYPVFSESNISNESLGVAMQISVAIVGFECITNMAIWSLVKRIYKINLWREYIFNMADDPLIIRINFLIGIHVLGDMLLAVVDLKFKP